LTIVFPILLSCCQYHCVSLNSYNQGGQLSLFAQTEGDVLDMRLTVLKPASPEQTGIKQSLMHSSKAEFSSTYISFCFVLFCFVLFLTGSGYGVQAGQNLSCICLPSAEITRYVPSHLAQTLFKWSCM
jgi:hypothetical protein